jgi:hypothetical protein
MTECSDILKFLDHICIKFGFCLPACSRAKIASEGPYQADDFARIVLEEEGLNPDFELKNFRSLRNEFLNFFGP